MCESLGKRVEDNWLASERPLFIFNKTSGHFPYTDIFDETSGNFAAENQIFQTRSDEALVSVRPLFRTSSKHL